MGGGAARRQNRSFTERQKHDIQCSHSRAGTSGSRKVGSDRIRPVADIRQIICYVGEMKLYLVQAAVSQIAQQAEVDARLRACIEPIADLILPHLLVDPALFGMRHGDEASKPPLAMTERYGYAEVVQLKDRDTLRAALVACGDPNSGQWMLIRSLVTCRAVFYGYDGQAFVCLPHEAPPIRSANAAIDVSDESHLLANSDWLDGLRSD